MSAMGIGDSKDQMRASNWLMGRLTLNLIIPYMLKVMTTYFKMMRMNISASKSSIRRFVITEKAVVAAFNQEKALEGGFSVITNLRMDPRSNQSTSAGAATARSSPPSTRRLRASSMRRAPR